MNCFLCGKNTKYIFCGDCTPRYGDSVILPNTTVFVGSFPLRKVLLSRFSGRQIIRWWVGTDVLVQIQHPPGKSILKNIASRIKRRLVKPDRHWCVSKKLRDELQQIGIQAALVEWPPKNQKKVFRKKVIYYFPEPVTKYNKWVYGKDLIDQVKQMFKDLAFIRYDGSCDFSDIIGADCFYLRPNQYDGMPLTVLYCRDNQIPYYWSIGGKPSVKKIERALNEFRKDKS